MRFDAFKASTSSRQGGQPPPELSPELRALWLDGSGDWDAAHQLADAIGGTSGASIHAYLHRKEGDLDNARYWYRRAGRKPFEGALEAEWTALVREFLRDPA